MREEDLYPLKLEVSLRETIWGGHSLERLIGQQQPEDRRIGEAWVVWDGLRISNGPLRGRRLAGVVKGAPDLLLGAGVARKYGPILPLLAKLIDARDTLSVQVHPDDRYALEHDNQPFGKSEAWYIVDAEPGSTIIHGFKHAVERSDVSSAIASSQLGELLQEVEVKAGDVIYNPAGAVHALGKGVVVYELQQSSDLTYRLYDWGRKQADGKSRALHVDKALDVLITEPFSTHTIRPLPIPGVGFDMRLLCVCRYFAVERMSLKSPVRGSTSGLRFHVLTVLEGHVRVSGQSGSHEMAQLGVGESVLIPAGLEEYEVQPVEQQAVVIRGYVPDLMDDIVVPLRRQGVSDADILQLGGPLAGNDLIEVMSNE